jgi:DUF971 family protein
MMKIQSFILDNDHKELCIEFVASEKVADVTLSFEYLRICSPENSAKKMKNGQATIISHKKDVVLINIESVAKHGYRLIFDDGHNAIYSEDTLQVIAVECEERWSHYLSELKASGHSREAMIDFKHL